ESLIITYGDSPKRAFGPWRAGQSGHLLRIHAGLEDPDDLIADLQRGLTRLNAG
ncbi:MAG TPA: cystathionine beta-lyase, partial [Rhodospirillales bacterium]|nr:cystathionine beta-lyase [Rhodospirillales bacterium]